MRADPGNGGRLLWTGPGSYFDTHHSSQPNPGRGHTLPDLPTSRNLDSNTFPHAQPYTHTQPYTDIYPNRSSLR